MIDYLADVARKAAERAGFPFHLERSNPSEAVYLRVERGGYWFGLRIASHVPAHTCSADFAQLYVPPVDLPDSWVQEAISLVEKFVLDGGKIVADPREIQQAIEQAFLNRRLDHHRLPSTSEVCAIRHRLNFRARWTFDEEQALLGLRQQSD